MDALQVKLSDEEIRNIREVVSKADVVGGRYNDHMAATLEG